MVRQSVKDPIFLGRKSRPATAADLPVAQDLLDTLSAHRERCVGLAANMIGQAVQIIVFDQQGTAVVMLNPEILRAADRFETEEGCLSLPGVRKTTRFRTIKVRYQNQRLQTRIQTFTGWTAQIIQHEIDHLRGILI